MSISEVLYSVFVRAASHSRGQYSEYEQCIARIDAYSETILVTLDKIKNMPSEIRDDYKKRIEDKYLNEYINLAFRYGKKDDFHKYYSKLTKKKRIHRLMKLSFSIGCRKLFCFIVSYFRLIKRKFVLLLH